MTVAESTAQKNNPSGGWELIHVNGDDLGNPGLSHGDAVQHFGGLHRLLLWVTRTNCECSLISLIISVKRSRLASSSGASTSSRKQNGLGLVKKIAKRRLTAVRAFSPPERSVMDCSFLPGG